MNEVNYLLFLVVGVIVGILLWKAYVSTQQAKRLGEENAELADFLNGRVKELTRIMSEQHSDRTSMEEKMMSVIKEIELRNSNGSLDDFIADNKQAINEVLNERYAT